MIHNPTHASGTHDVSNYLPSNPSSPFASKQVLALGDAIQPALVCPIHYPASFLVCPLVCPLHYPLAFYCYVIQPDDLFPSSVQHYCPLNNANLLQSTTIVVASYKARKRFLHEYLHLQIHSILNYSDIIMHLKINEMLSH